MGFVLVTDPVLGGEHAVADGERVAEGDPVADGEGARALFLLFFLGFLYFFVAAEISRFLSIVKFKSQMGQKRANLYANTGLI